MQANGSLLADRYRVIRRLGSVGIHFGLSLIIAAGCVGIARRRRDRVRIFRCVASIYLHCSVAVLTGRTLSIRAIAPDHKAQGGEGCDKR